LRDQTLFIAAAAGEALIFIAAAGEAFTPHCSSGRSLNSSLQPLEKEKPYLAITAFYNPYKIIYSS